MMLTIQCLLSVSQYCKRCLLVIEQGNNVLCIEYGAYWDFDCSCQYRARAFVLFLYRVCVFSTFNQAIALQPSTSQSFFLLFPFLIFWSSKLEKLFQSEIEWWSNNEHCEDGVRCSSQLSSCPEVQRRMEGPP